jgi:carbon-monoxide dehydrogenase medium subunit
VLVVGPAGRREMAVADVVVGPGRIALARDELVHSFRLPPRPARAADAYLRLIPRTEMDIAVVGCGVNLVLAADGTIAAARVALGAVAPTALLLADAAAALLGRRLDEPALAALDAAARAACRPIDDKRGTIAYRTKIAGVLARRAAAIAYRRAEART